MRALLLLAMLLLAACAGEAPSAVPCAERLAADRAALEARLARMASDGLHERLMAAIGKQLDREKAPRWILLEGFALKHRELWGYRKWNSPLEGADGAAGSGPAFALDLERPLHPYRTIRHYAEAMRARGIELLVVAVPSRLHVYPDLLPGVGELPPDFDGVDPGFAALQLALVDAGVEVLDLLPLLVRARRSDAPQEDEHVFLGYDPHWTPRGVRLAADAIAERVRSFDWFEPGAERPGEAYHLVRERLPFVVHQNNPIEQAARPVELWFERILDAKGAPAHEPDPRSPILVLGDSFSDYYSEFGADLTSLLYARLGRRLDLVRQESGIGTDPLWRTVARQRRGLEGKRLVLWLWNVDTLVYPEWEPLPIFDD